MPGVQMYSITTDGLADRNYQGRRVGSTVLDSEEDSVVNLRFW
jgi:hypothetical protein